MICPECGNDPTQFIHEKNCSELAIPQESLEDRVARLERWVEDTARWSDSIVAELENRAGFPSEGGRHD